MPFFVPGSKENAKRPKDVGEWTDIDYHDGLRDPRGYLHQRYDYRKGYGITLWDDRLLEETRGIMEKYHVHRYLELGCAKGFRVQAYRMQGVEAWGIDISKYATSNCHPEMKKWILCQDATDLSRFEDGFFDYIYSWDFLEHLYPDEIRKCLNECRRVGNGWMFHGLTYFDKNYVSIAQAFHDEPQDPTHVSCYRLEWWKEMIYSIFDKDEIKEWKASMTTKRRGVLQFRVKLQEINNG